MDVWFLCIRKPYFCAVFLFWFVSYCFFASEELQTLSTWPTWVSDERFDKVRVSIGPFQILLSQVCPSLRWLCVWTKECRKKCLLTVSNSFV